MFRGLFFGLSFLFLADSPVWGAGASLADAYPDDPVIYLTDLSPDWNFEQGPESLFVEVGETTSKDKPIVVYVPLESSYNGEGIAGGNLEYFMDDVLPDIRSAHTGTGELEFRLDVELGGVDHYLHVALELPSDRYKMIKTPILLEESNEENNFEYKITVSFNELCSSIDSRCADLVDTTTPPGQTRNLKLAFFLSETNQGTGEVNIGDYPASLFYEVSLSNKVDRTGEIKLLNLIKGDGQLYVKYEGFEFSNLYSLYAYVLENPDRTCTLGPQEGKTTYGNAVHGGEWVDLEGGGVKGELALSHLSNNKCYAVRVFYGDKYGFASQLSNRLAQSPEPIEALLKKQACFFLTAGFGREHFVVEFFMDFRDRILKSFALGRAFIDFYERVAPQYAPLVLESPFLAALVRILAYTLYFFLCSPIIICLFLFLMGFFFVVFWFRKQRRNLFYGRS